MSIDLSTTYLRLKLDNPIVVGACPLTGDSTNLLRLEEAGAAAVVMPSLFEEQIELERSQLMLNGDNCKDATSSTPDMSGYNAGPDACLRHVEMTKKSVSIPVIGSLNGTSHGGWLQFARLMEQAGADALELNLFLIATDIETSTKAIEDCYVDVVAAVREAVSIPLAVKIGPYFAALPFFAKRLVDAGANGLVLFNRFLEPEFDLDTFEVQPYLEFSHQSELRSPLRWIAVLRDQLDVSLAATSGIHDSRDVLKAILAGADIAMIASSLLRHGADHLSTILAGLKRWLDDHDYSSTDQLRGVLSRQNYHDQTAYERGNYMRAISTYTGPLG